MPRILTACLTLACSLWGIAALAQSVPDPFVKALTVAPAAGPVPLFKHRLLPLSSERNPGNAAPVYLRIRYGVSDSDWNAIEANAKQWLALSPDQFPVAEARKFVDGWSKPIQQLEFGARRATCDWGYTLPEEKLDVFTILLPDVQGMKNWSHLLAIKARVEVAEGKFDDAIRTMETGIALARHVAEGPFLINKVVGIMLASATLATYDDLVSRPGAPNLYWALTALPRPLIGLRDGFEQEMKVVDRTVPELSGLDQARTDAEWSAHLARLHARLVALGKVVYDPQRPVVIADPDLARFTATALPHAREYLRTRQGLSAEEAEKRPTGRAIAEYLAGAVRERGDAVFRLVYLSYPEAIAATGPKTVSPSDPAGQLVEGLFPGMHGLGAEARLERHVAALRVIEAIRLHAAAHQGTLPASLDAITEVPVPLDPITGKAFGYRVTAERAELSASNVSMAPKYRLSYAITLGKNNVPAK